MKATDNKFGKSGWRQAKGTRVIALVEKKNEAIFDKLSEKKKGYVSNFSTSNSEIDCLFKKAEGQHGWEKIKGSLKARQ